MRRGGRCGGGGRGGGDVFVCLHIAMSLLQLGLKVCSWLLRMSGFSTEL